MNKHEVLQELARARVVAVVRTTEALDLTPAVEALMDEGLRAIEVTMTVPAAMDVIRDWKGRFGDRVVLGAGTVMDRATAEQAAESGAEFLVSPSLTMDLLKARTSEPRVIVLGAFTPSEIYTAWEAGADVVKVFPIRSLGARYLRDVLAPMPQLRLMPTGGVTEESAPELLRAGAFAVGMGGELLDLKLVRAGRLDELRARARRLMAGLQAIPAPVVEHRASH
ncbi:MAG: bifunctional 4-hydroxy-2-oxoglutarate aldolase/2-dehydro-3-deoxy-phosphogluconate aldolase [Anaerolineales bacterium]